MGTPARAAIYCRISDDSEGTEAGVTRQRADCLARAEREGWSVVKVYEENDVGASRHSKKKRPLYAEMLAMAERGEVDVIVAYSNSRLTRRPRELEDFIDLNERKGTQVRTVVSGDDNLATADGRMVARIKASVDANEADRISERVRRSTLDRVAAGAWLGGPRPFGWKTTTVKLEKKTVHLYHQLEPTEAKMVKDGIDHIIAGGSVGELIRQWTASGVPTARGTTVWRHIGINRILTRHRNAGIMEHRGVVQPNVKTPWKPICTPDELNQVRAVLLNPNRAKGPGFAATHLLSGIPRCGRCDHKLISGAVRSRGKTYRMYRCSGPRCGLAMKIDDLDAVVSRHVRRAYLHGPNDRFSAASAETQGLLAETHRALAAVLAERREVEEAINDGLLTIAAVRPTLTRLVDSERRLREDLTRHLRDDAHAAMMASVAGVYRSDHRMSLTEAGAGMRARWEAMDLTQQRRLIRSLFTVTVMPGRGPERVVIEEAV